MVDNGKTFVSDAERGNGRSFLSDEGRVHISGSTESNTIYTLLPKKIT